MSLFPARARREAMANIQGPLIPARDGGRGTGTVTVTNTTAMRHSAVWACLALRAGLMSTFPVDVFRRVNGIQVEVPKPPVLVSPGGDDWRWIDWVYATQVDLDRAGNAIGLIRERDGNGKPSRIELQDIGSCSVIRPANAGPLKYRIGGKVFDREQVWHERAYVVAGCDVGLSPIAYAAWSIGEYLSMQQFALDWFGGAAVPKARLKDTMRSKVDPKEAGIIRDRWRATINNGDLFVHGKDWEYDLMQAEAAGTEWIEGRRFGLSDITRFFQCPADLIDAAISAPGTLTYASITQRNLQFLIMQLGPAVARREDAWSFGLLSNPRYVKLNTNALLRMDPGAQGRLLDAAILSRRLTVDEARELDNRPPLTDTQIAEFAALFGAPRTAPVTSTGTTDKSALSAEEVDMLERELGPVRAVATVGEPIGRQG